VVVRFPAGPRARLKTVDPPKGNGLGQKKCCKGTNGEDHMADEVLSENGYDFEGTTIEFLLPLG
jgi:hypothetical protein